MLSFEGSEMQDIKDLIDRLVPHDCGVNHEYCILKQICASQFKTHPRDLVQIKCVEIFKWYLNKENNEEIDISQVWLEWIERGYAKIFSDVYEENGPDVPIQEIYNMVAERVL